MIATVTPNPALDVTYDVHAELLRNHHYRVDEVRVRPGGKGINVARVLHALGEPVRPVAFSGGFGGRRLAAGLAELGIDAELVEVLPDVRRTLVVRDGADGTTSLWEPGQRPDDPRGAERALRARVAAQLPRTRALAISGSLPVGIDAELPARLALDAQQVGIPVAVDVDGDALRIAVSAGAAIVLPNLDELSSLGVDRPTTPAQAAQAAGELVNAHGLPGMMVTLGAEGMAAAWPGGAAWAKPVEHVDGNPTGAGDAACAALVRRLATGRPADWPAILADAVALSASAVVQPAAGDVDLEMYHRWRPQIRVEPA